MSFWTKSGAIVVDGSGNPIDCASCPCGMNCVCTCGSCPAGAAAQWTVELPGITDAGCIDCGNYASITLDYSVSCAWTATVTICGFAHTVTCQYAAGVWTLTLPTIPSDTVYSLTEATPDCTVAKTLALVAHSDLGCTNWPDPVTVTPVGSGACTTVCTTCCTDGIPTTLHATITSDCAGINGLVVTIVWDAGLSSWIGTATAGNGDLIKVQLACFGGWNIQAWVVIAGTPFSIYDDAPTSSACPPSLDIVFPSDVGAFGLTGCLISTYSLSFDVQV